LHQQGKSFLFPLTKKIHTFGGEIMAQKHVIPSVILFLFLAFTMIGCGGGGGGESSTPTGSPTLQVLPASYDFGTVTTSNSPALLEVRIKNNGTAALHVSTITLSDSSNFSLISNGGSKPCASGSPTIPAVDSCTFQVGFRPGADGTFPGNVQIRSNDGSSPVFTLTLNGTAEPVDTLTVRINQLETSCPISDVVNAYVSVTDQGGYPLSGLVKANFTVTEGLEIKGITTATYVDIAYEAISIAAVMDYSSSQTVESIADMQNGFINLFNNLRGTDFGEIVKFSTRVNVVQPWTSDKAALVAAVSASYPTGNTRLYDAVFQAVDDTALKTDFRRALVVATDGGDNPDPNYPGIHSLTDVINNASTKGVPIFTIGIGSSINIAVLEQMANDTGGQFFEALTSQNLATIYQQLTSVLYEKQYILTFNQSVLGSVGTANLNIKATTPLGIFGDDTVLITSCR
jgi:VWFA-related protein